MDYVDIGSSDSEDEGRIQDPTAAMDSDEEEQYENARILKMLMLKSTPSSKTRKEQRMLDFEAEMEAELDRRANMIEVQGGMEHQRSLSRSSSSSSLHSLPGTTKGGGKHSTPGSPSKKKVKFAADTKQDQNQNQQGSSSNSNPIENAAKEPEFYDQVYFDSDESEGEENDESKKKRKAKRKVMTNDELFYDPESDAADQAWVDKQRRKFYSPGIMDGISGTNKSQDKSNQNEPSASTSSSASTSDIPLPKTDAVLNCPACFTVLCMDCQRHEFYSGQYRAMFVMNCGIDKSQTLTVPLKVKKEKGKRNKKGNRNTAEETISSIATSDSDKFFPVKCKVCNTQVAVYDCEEIYHFFNCLASNP